jgi:membrane protein implicated in regulation of membrane protease activity
MQDFFSVGWLWLYAGAAVMLFELLTPGFVVFFFGLSAATVGALRLSVGDAFGQTWQIVSFSVLTILYLAFLRRWCKRLFAGVSDVSTVRAGAETVGRRGEIVVAVDPPRTGRALVGDSEWTVEADRPLAVSAPVVVVAQDNLTLSVRPA